MSFRTVKKGTLEYLISTIIDTPHCFSTRFGGVSEGYLSSLNLGIHRGDRFENCMENYRILGEAVGFVPEDVVFSRQVHTTEVQRVTAADRDNCLRPDGVLTDRDGMITDSAHVALTVFGADCPTILLYDPVRHAAGALHAGWRGTVAGMAARGVERMAEEFGSRPEDIRAAIGPCIGPCCFETHSDVPDAVLAAMGEEGRCAIRPLPQPDADGRAKFRVDLRLLNEKFLRKAGVREIDICPDCTACNPARYWSHRITKGNRGSQASVILLRDPSEVTL